MAIKKESIRNLSQYKGMSDEEFDLYYENILLKDDKEIIELRKRAKKKIDELGNDYDLTDLKYNDLMQLNDLASAMVTLETLQEVIYKEQKKGIDDDNIAFVEKLNRVTSSVRSDVSKIQGDLNLSRKIRKGEKEESVLEYIDKVRDYAKRRYEEVMSFVFCPECKMLLSTIWFLYPEQYNEITMTCDRLLSDGTKCGKIFKVTSKELMSNRGYSEKGVFPK
jgi:hypothetical protein